MTKPVLEQSSSFRGEGLAPSPFQQAKKDHDGAFEYWKKFHLATMDAYDKQTRAELEAERDEWKRKCEEANIWGLRETARWKTAYEERSAECVALAALLREVPRGLMEDRLVLRIDSALAKGKT